MLGQSDHDAPDQDQPEGEVFDHTVPKPKNLGTVLLVGLVFLGGGQLVKGHVKRFLALWAALAVLLASIVAAATLTDPESMIRSVALYAGGGGLVFLWFYALWDAVTRV